MTAENVRGGEAHRGSGKPRSGLLEAPAPLEGIECDWSEVKDDLPGEPLTGASLPVRYLKTVESHLSHAYSKLGLSGQGSRAGLAKALRR